MSYLSKRVREVKPSATLLIIQRARELQAQGKDILNLAGGEPDFGTPKTVCDAAKKAIDQQQTTYTAAGGKPTLITAIAKKFQRENSLIYEPAQIIASTGAKQSLYNAFMATVNPGDEVIILAPYWVSYPDMVLLAEGKPIILQCPEEQGFKVTPGQLEAAITEKTKWLILNSPGNPTGAVYSHDELQKIGEVLKRHPQVLIMSDDVYEHIVYDKFNFHSFAEACPDLYDRTITLNAVSKTYAMTGWRLGYAAGPVEIIKTMRMIQSQSTSNPCSISQAAAEEALTGPQDYIQKWHQIYQQRRDHIVQAVNEIPGFSCSPPQGAFYLYINCADLIGRSTPEGKKLGTDIDVCAFLLEAEGIAAVPGTEFGLSPYFRVSFAVSETDLMQLAERLRGVEEKLT
jgi:aspartate aminotransferase